MNAMHCRLRSLLVVSLLLGSARLGFANCATDDPTGSKTLAARQQVVADCPCDHTAPPATNHGQYVKCAAGVANTRSGLDPSDPSFLPKTCKGQVKKCAARSSCGKRGFVTCCVPKADGTSQCKTRKESVCVSPGQVGLCDSCCDACPYPGSGPTCPSL